jgi:hypothetical protein
MKTMRSLQTTIKAILTDKSYPQLSYSGLGHSS